MATPGLANPAGAPLDGGGILSGGSALGVPANIFSSGAINTSAGQGVPANIFSPGTGINAGSGVPAGIFGGALPAAPAAPKPAPQGWWGKLTSGISNMVGDIPDVGGFLKDTTSWGGKLIGGLGSAIAHAPAGIFTIGKDLLSPVWAGSDKQFKTGLKLLASPFVADYNYLAHPGTLATALANNPATPLLDFTAAAGTVLGPVASGLGGAAEGAAAGASAGAAAGIDVGAAAADTAAATAQAAAGAGVDASVAGLGRTITPAPPGAGVGIAADRGVLSGTAPPDVAAALLPPTPPELSPLGVSEHPTPAVPDTQGPLGGPVRPTPGIPSAQSVAPARSFLSGGISHSIGYQLGKATAAGLDPAAMMRLSSGLAKGSDILNQAMAAPMLPVRIALRSPRFVGDVAMNALDRGLGMAEPAVGVGGRFGGSLREAAVGGLGARLAPWTVRDEIKGTSVRGEMLAHLSQLSTQSRDLVRAAKLGGEAVSSRMKEYAGQIAGKVTKLLPNPDEMNAFYHTQELSAGAQDALINAHAALGDEGYKAFMKRAGIAPGAPASPGAIELLRQVRAGEAPELAARFEAAQAKWDHGFGAEGIMGARARDEAYLASHPAQGQMTAFAPAVKRASAGVERTALDSTEAARIARAHATDLAESHNEMARVLDVSGMSSLEAAMHGEAMGRLSATLRIAQDAASSAEAKAASDRQIALSVRNFALDNIANAPSAWRPQQALITALADHVNYLISRGAPEAADMLRAALEDVPATVREAEAAGIHIGADIRYMPHGALEAMERKGRRGLTGQPAITKLDAEKIRSGSLTYAANGRTLLRHLDQAAVREGELSQVAKINEKVGLQLGQGALADARSAEDAMRAGYTYFAPRAFFNTSRVATVLSKESTAAEIAAFIDNLPSDAGSSAFIPTSVFNEFARLHSARELPGLAAAIGRVTNIPYYYIRLEFSPSLAVGRVFGHTFLHLIGGHGPTDVAGSMLAAYQRWRASSPLDHAERNFEFMPARLQKANPTDRAMLAETMGRAVTPEVRLGIRKVGGVLRKGAHLVNMVGEHNMRFAHFWDNLSRAAYYMRELERTGGNEDAAVVASLRALGAFDELTGVEKNIVRPFVPFYAWHKEITRIVMHMALDHPAATGWFAYMGQLGGAVTPPWLPPFYQGDTVVGKYLFSPGFLLPFSEVGSSFGGAFLGLGKTANPVVKAAIGDLLAINPSSGKNYYEPPGYRQVFGRPAPPPLAQQLKTAIPQLGLIRSLLGGTNRPYATYANGQPIIKATSPTPLANPDNVGWAGNLLSNLGLGLANAGEVKAQAGISAPLQAKSKLTLAHSAANYAKRVQTWNAAGQPVNMVSQAP
ncbi:MAG: hypothetical protein ACRD6B_03855 [Bryobacteraceae bacterium]